MNESAIINSAIKEMERAFDLTRRLQSLIMLGDYRESLKGSAKFLSGEVMQTCSTTLSALKSHPLARSKRRKLQGGSAAEVRGPDLRRSRSSVRKEVTAAPYDDGHQWRKYGEKIIKGCFLTSRSYYRCTFSDETSCQARKQVQPDPNDPTLFLVLYKGDHTCNSNSATQESSPVQTATSNLSSSGSPQPQQHAPFLLRFDSKPDPETAMMTGSGNELAISSNMNITTGDEDLSSSTSSCKLAFIDRSGGGASSSGTSGFDDDDDKLLLPSLAEEIMGLLEFDFDGILEEFASTNC